MKQNNIFQVYIIQVDRWLGRQEGRQAGKYGGRQVGREVDW